MAALILLVFSAYGLGSLLCAGFTPSSVDRLFRFACCLTLGMGVWCLLLFGAGLAGLLKPAVITTAAAICSGIAIRQFVQGRSGIHFKVSLLTKTEWLLVCTSAFFLLITFIASFAPVTGGITNDEVHTHLSVPAAWLRSGTIAPQPYPVSYMAANGELLFLFATIFSRDSGPHLVSWLSLLLTAVFIYSIARRFLTRTPSLIAAAIVMVNPLLFRGAPVAFVDSIASLFMIAALASYLRWRREPTAYSLVMAAFFAGIGCGVKPTNVVYTAVLAFLVLFDIVRTLPGRRLRNVAMAAAVLIVTAAPWPVRLLVLTGSPTFPPPSFWSSTGLPQKIMKGQAPYSAATVEDFYRYVYSRYGDYKRSWMHFLTLPWDMTMKPERFQIGDSVGTLLLSLLPIALIIVAAVRKYRTMVVLPVFTILSCAGIYALVLPEARYFGTAFCALSPMIAVPFAHEQRYRLLRAGCLVVFMINVLFSTVVALRVESGNLRMVVDRQYRIARQKAHTPFFETLRFIADNRNRRELVVMYDSPVWYYLQGPYVVDGEAYRHPGKYRDAWLLDIDFSQVAGRTPEDRKGDYAITGHHGNLQPVFRGPDARLYRFNLNQ